MIAHLEKSRDNAGKLLFVARDNIDAQKRKYTQRIQGVGESLVSNFRVNSIIFQNSPAPNDGSANGLELTNIPVYSNSSQASVLTESNV